MSEAAAVPFAYLVLAHRHIDQILRNAAGIRLRDPDADVYLAYNGALDDSDRADVELADLRRVGSGRLVDWAAYNQLESVIEALQEIDPDVWVVLVSGDSYPVGDLRSWQHRVLSSGADVVFEGAPVDDDDPMMVARFRYRWFVWRRPHQRASLTAFRIVHAIGARFRPRPRLRVLQEGIAVGYRRRRVVPDVDMKGSAWFAIGPEARRRLLRLSGQSLIKDLFRDSLIPDESYVHTLAALDGWKILAEPVMHVVWPYPGATHPRSLGPDDAEGALASGAPFARKLNTEGGERLAAILDARWADQADLGG